MARLSGLWHAARARLAALLGRGRLDAQLDEELAFHLDALAEKNRRAGMSRDEARRAARRTLGNEMRIRADHREARGLSVAGDILQDVVYGLRMLRAHPWYAAAAVLTLAIGIGAVTTIYTTVSGLVLEPVPYADLDRLVILGETNRPGGLPGEGWVHSSDLPLLRGQRAFDRLVPLQLRLTVMTGAGDPVDVVGYRTPPEYFEMLGVRPILGRLYDDGADQDAVVLSQEAWQRHFDAAPDAVGRSVRIEGRDLTIVGVLPRGTAYPMGTDFWGPPPLAQPDTAGSEPRRVAVVGRLAEGVSLAQARQAVGLAATTLAERDPQPHESMTLGVEPLRDIISYGTRAMLTVLMGAAAFLLLLVCANVATMQLALGTSRHGEMALRMALGAGRARLVRQLLTESLFVALAGALLGAVVAVWAGGLIRASLAAESLRYFFTSLDGIRVDGDVLVFTALVTVGSAVVFGTLPALRTSQLTLSSALTAAAGRAATNRGRLRRGLVVFEVVLSIALLCGAGLMVTSFGAISRLERGFDEDVWTLQVLLRGDAYREEAAVRAFTAESLRQIDALPGVGAVAVTDAVPGFRAGRTAPVILEGADGVAPDSVRAQTRVASASYFDALGVALAAGRVFTEADGPAAERVAVVSAALADRVDDGSGVVGRRLRVGEDGPWTRIIGVAGDVATAWNDDRAAAIVYVSWQQVPARTLPRLLVRTTGEPEEVLPVVRSRIWAVDDEVPIAETRTVGQAIDERFGALGMATRAMLGAAATAILLCIGGIYALVAYSAGRRIREVGVRIALGARRAEVTRMLVREGLVTTLCGLAIGLPVGWMLSRVIAGFLGGVSALGSVTLLPAALFMGLATVLLAVAAGASYVPARRAASTDPVITLRAE